MQLCILLLENVAISQTSREIPFVVGQVLDMENAISALCLGWSGL